MAKIFRKIDYKINRIIVKYSNRLGIDLNYLIKGSLWTTSNQTITLILGIILSVFLARLTTKEVFGNYNFLISIIAMLSLIAMPGFNIALQKSVSRGKDGVYTKSVKLSFIWSLIGIPVLLLLGLYYYFFQNNMIGIGLLLAAILFPFFYAPNNWQNLLIGKKRFDLFSKNNIIQTLTTTIAIIIATILGKGSLLPIFMSYMLFNVFFNIIYYYKSKKFIENTEEEKNWKSTGYKLTFVEFTLISYQYIDKIIIGIILGPTQLAIYAIAVAITSIGSSSFSEIFNVLTPKILKMKKELIISNLKRLMPRFIIINLILLIIYVLLIPFLIKLFYSEKYVQSIFYAQIYTLTIPLAIIMSITNTALVGINKENILLNLRIIGTVLLFSSYLILIPLLGIIGAIISSIIYYAVLDILQYFYLIKK